MNLKERFDELDQRNKNTVMIMLALVCLVIGLMFGYSYAAGQCNENCAQLFKDSCILSDTYYQYELEDTMDYGNLSRDHPAENVIIYFEKIRDTQDI